MSRNVFLILTSITIFIVGCIEEETEKERRLRSSLPLANGYYYFDDGRVKNILRELPSGKLDAFVRGRTDTYVFIDEIIYVARRPYNWSRSKSGDAEVSVSGKCDYLRIDTVTNEVITLGGIAEDLVPDGVYCLGYYAD